MLSCALAAALRHENAGALARGLTGLGHFRGQLSLADLLETALRDLASERPLPFADLLVELAPELLRLTDDEVERLLSIAAQQRTMAAADYLAQAWQILLPDRARPSLAQLPGVDRSQRILELPGTAGWLAGALLPAAELTWRDNLVIACADRRERVLAGLIILESGQASTKALLDAGVVPLATELAGLAPHRPDWVIGAAARWSPAEVALVFPQARIALV
jgi:hypothetical protein